MPFDPQLMRKELVEISHLFYQRGWALATSGNYSVRLNREQVLITASAKDKGALIENDLILINLAGGGETDSQARPSSEALLHCELYRFDDQIRAVLHTHSLHTTILSTDTTHITIGGYEMLKALRGVTSPSHKETIPIFPNHQDMGILSKTTREYLTRNPQTHGFLIAGHGLYSWGRDLSEAKWHIEALEFLLECEYRKLMIKS